MAALRCLVLFSDMVLEFRLGQEGGWPPRINLVNAVTRECVSTSPIKKLRTYFQPRTSRTRPSGLRIEMDDD
jgi:hypothetical protein